MGIALHVNHAELNIGIWEKAAGDREETREVVLNDKQDPPQAALSEVAKDELPIFEVFATEPGSATENTLSAVAKETDSKVDGRLTKAIGFANFDILGVEIEDGEIGIKRARIAHCNSSTKASATRSSPDPEQRVPCGEEPLWQN